MQEYPTKYVSCERGYKLTRHALPVEIADCVHHLMHRAMKIQQRAMALMEATR